MSYILNISTAVPEHQITSEDFAQFYKQAFSDYQEPRFFKLLNYLSKKTKIDSRYSCVPDYKGNERELYTNGDLKQSIEKRMDIFKKKIVPLASKAIDQLFAESNILPTDITHLITVSCTGLMAPGLEFFIAEQYGLQHTEKSALNFLGCYAALKAIKQAHYIAQSNPEACVLIVSAELCSLHFSPSTDEEDIISNLLFADGASALLLCGSKNKLSENKLVLQIDDIGTGFIPNTADLMSWNISSSVFKMHLSPKVVNTLKNVMEETIGGFLTHSSEKIDFWAIHPGGAKIVEAVQESLHLTDENVADSFEVLRNYGNMSSPTILFVLKSIFDKIRLTGEDETKNIFACAFGPGLNIEMLRLSSLHASIKNPIQHLMPDYVTEG